MPEDHGYNSATFDGYTILSPIQIAEDLEASDLPVPEEIWKANHFTNPLSATAIGHILMLRRDLDKIDFNADDHVLRISTPPLEEMEARNLVIVPGKCHRVGMGKADDPASPYLVEIANRSWFGDNPFYACQIRTPADVENDILNENQETFNIPNGIYPGQFFDDSRRVDALGERNDWTWADMVLCLWPPFLGSKPPYDRVLPFEPHGKPVGFDFRAVPHLEAFYYLLARLDCDLRYDPAEGTYDIIETGVDDPDLAKAIKTLTEQGRQLNTDDFMGDLLLRPGGVTVCFHVESTQPGSEDTYAKDGNAWRMNSIYKAERLREEVLDETSTGSALTQEIYHLVWDDLIAKFDPFSGTITNLAEVEARADERAERFYRDVENVDEYYHKTFSGCCDITPGPMVKAVSWRQDDEDGWITEIVYHPAVHYVINRTGQLIPRDEPPARNRPYGPVPEYVLDYETFVGRCDGEADHDGWQPVTERKLNPGDNSVVDGIQWTAKDPNA